MLTLRQQIRQLRLYFVTRSLSTVGELVAWVALFIVSWKIALCIYGLMWARSLRGAR